MCWPGPDVNIESPLDRLLPRDEQTQPGAVLVNSQPVARLNESSDSSKESKRVYTMLPSKRSTVSGSGQSVVPQLVETTACDADIQNQVIGEGQEVSMVTCCDNASGSLADESPPTVVEPNRRIGFWGRIKDWIARR
jgi:hypothetical protein